MDVFLDSEGEAGDFQHHAEVDVEGRGILRKAVVERVLDIAAGEFDIGRVDRLSVGFVHIFEAEEAALAVHLGLAAAVVIHDHHRRDIEGSGDFLVVRTEGRGDVDDTGTVLGRHVVAGNHAEGVAFQGLEPGNQLLVAHADEFGAFHGARKHLVRDLIVEPRTDQGLGDDVGRGGAGIRIRGFYPDIVDVRTDAEGSVRRKGPGRRRPGQEVEVFLSDDFELDSHGRIRHVLVAAGLVQLVGAQARAVGRTVRLDRVALVEEPLVVDVAEEPPEGLDVTVVVSDVRVLHVDPVTDALGHRLPFGGILHDLTAAGLVVLRHGDLRADVFLVDAEFLLDADFDRKSVGIPAGATGNAVAGLRLIAADGVLDGAGHDVVDTRHAVGGRRTFKEDKLGSAFPQLQGFLEGTDTLPALQNLVSDRYQIQPFVFLESHIFSLFL